MSEIILPTPTLKATTGVGILSCEIPFRTDTDEKLANIL